MCKWSNMKHCVQCACRTCRRDNRVQAKHGEEGEKLMCALSNMQQVTTYVASTSTRIIGEEGRDANVQIV